METGFSFEGSCYKWASYGFNQDGILCIEEYYPNAIVDTYGGISAYIYTADIVEDIKPLGDIPGTFTTDKCVEVKGCEFISDAYEAIMEAVSEGKTLIQKYEDMSTKKREWVEETITEEYRNKREFHEYIHFLKGKFDFLS